MSLQTVLDSAAEVQMVYLLETTAMKTIKTWAEASTDTPYSFELPFQPSNTVPVNMFFNGELLDQVDTVDGTDGVLNTPGSWTWVDGVLYVRLPEDENPRAEENTVVVELQMYFATHAKTFNDNYYQPFLTSTPKLQLRVEQKFNGLPQVGGGDSVFQNANKFFDGLTDLDWDGGRTTIRLGADRPQFNDFMVYADYVVIGTWLNDQWTKTDQDFTVVQTEIKQQLQTNIPQRLYSLELYPNMAENDIGKPIPLAYGKIFGAAPTSINGQASGDIRIATDGTFLYVADSFNNRIVKRRCDTLEYVAQIGTNGTGNDQFANPLGITTDGTHLYIADTGNNRVVKRLCSDLSHVSNIGTNGSGNDQFANPGAITTDGTHIYVVDTGNSRIVKRLCSTLAYVSKIGTSGGGNDQFSGPCGITNDGTNLFVVDGGNNRVVKRLRSDLSYVSQVGTQGDGDNEFDNPQDITTDDTSLYITDTGNNRVVKRLCSDLTFVSKIGSQGNGEDEFNAPIGITTDDTNFYVADKNNNRLVKRLNSDLSFKSQLSIQGKRFKIADHAIYSLDDVRMMTSTGWTSIAAVMEPGDRAAGEFTLPGWDGESTISVDFKGRLNPDGSFMDNPADIVEDFLTFVGQADFDATSFSESREKLRLGTDLQTGMDVALHTPSLYLNASTSCISVIEQINSTVGSYLFVGADGAFRYVVFEPKPGEGLTSFEKLDILEFTEVTPSVQQEQGRISQITGFHSTRTADGWGQLTFQEFVQNQYSKNRSKPVLFDPFEVVLSSQSEADYWAQRTLIFLGRTPKQYRVKLPWRALSLIPTQQIRLGYDRHELNKVLEIMEVSIDDGKMEILCTDLHCFKDQVGFWSSTDDLLPARFAGLAGYGDRTDSEPDGSLFWNPEWADEIVAWVRQNIGYWCDTNGFACSADPRSYLASVWF